MTIKYDEETDTLRIRLTDARIVDSDEESPDVILDYDVDRNVIGIEILQASRRVGDPRTVLYQDVLPVALPLAA